MRADDGSALRLKRVIALKHARGRAKQGRFLVEGRRAITAAVERGVAIDVFIDEDALTAADHEVVDAVRRSGVVPTALSAVDLAAVSDTMSPQAIVATAPIPTLELGRTVAQAGSLILVIDGVQDPGNVGAILRCADAYAVDAAVLLAGTVDAWNPKVVRGAMGAHFHVALATSASPEDAFSTLAAHGYEPWIAVAHGGGAVAPAALEERKVALVIGGEASGPGATALDQPARRITIPTPGSAESLNVAVATWILLDRMLASRPSAS